MTTLNNNIMQFLQARQQELAQNKSSAKIERVNTFSTNENGYYPHRVIYVLSNMLLNATDIDKENGTFNYISKKTAKNMTYNFNYNAYINSLDIYENLKNLGIKNVIDIIENNEKNIKIIQNISGDYMLTTITSETMTSEKVEYNNNKKNTQFYR